MKTLVIAAFLAAVALGAGSAYAGSETMDPGDVPGAPGLTETIHENGNGVPLMNTDPQDTPQTATYGRATDDPTLRGGENN